jgi:hypothetical protein
MLIHRGKGHLPQITFTSDFHELVRGDLLPGPCVLRYDPQRIVPSGEIEGLPATQRPITAHVRFHPTGESWTGDMRFAPATRLLIDPDPAGQGTMLEAQFPLPDGCEELECWFSYVDNAGETHWDSALGANFWLRFPAYDLDLQRAELIARPEEALDQLQLELESVPVVDTIDVRWRYTRPPGHTRQQCALIPSTRATGGKHWSAPDGGIPVASDTPIIFDLVYTVGGHKFTDDNEGTWYIVS